MTTSQPKFTNYSAKRERIRPDVIHNRKLIFGLITVILFFSNLSFTQEKYASSTPLDVYFFLEKSEQLMKSSSDIADAKRIIKDLIDKIFTEIKKRRSVRSAIFLIGERTYRILPLTLLKQNQQEQIKCSLEKLFEPKNINCHQTLFEDRNINNFNHTDFTAAIKTMCRKINEYYNHSSDNTIKKREISFAIFSTGLQDQLNRELKNNIISSFDCFNKSPSRKPLILQWFFFHIGKKNTKFWNDVCEQFNGKYIQGSDYYGQKFNLSQDEDLKLPKLNIHIESNSYTYEPQTAEIYRVKFKITHNLPIGKKATLNLSISEENQEQVFLGIKPNSIEIEGGKKIQNITAEILLKGKIDRKSYTPIIKFNTDSEIIKSYLTTDKLKCQEIVKSVQTLADKIKIYPLEETIILNSGEDKSTKTFVVNFETQIGKPIKIRCKGDTHLPCIKENEYTLNPNGTTSIPIKITGNIPITGLMTGHITFKALTEPYKIYMADNNSNILNNRDALEVKLYKPTSWYVLLSYIKIISFSTILGICILWAWITLIKKIKQKHSKLGTEKINKLFKMSILLHKNYYYLIMKKARKFTIGNHEGNMRLALTPEPANHYKVVSLSKKGNQWMIENVLKSENSHNIKLDLGESKEDLNIGKTEKIDPKKKPKIIIDGKISIVLSIVKNGIKVTVSFNKEKELCFPCLKSIKISTPISLPVRKTLVSFVLFTLVLFWSVATAITFYLPQLPFKGWNATLLIFMGIACFAFFIHTIRYWFIRGYQEDIEIRKSKLNYLPFISLLFEVIRIFMK